MKYGKLAGSESLEFSLDGKVLLPEEAAEEYNRLKTVYEYKMDQLNQKYQIVVSELEDCIIEHEGMKDNLKEANKRIRHLAKVN